MNGPFLGKKSKLISIPEKSSITISLASFFSKILSPQLERGKLIKIVMRVKRKNERLLLKKRINVKTPAKEANVPPKIGR